MEKSRSTGPRSVEGKAVSSRNALKSGIYANSEVVLPHENPDDLQTLTTEYYDRFAPADPEQRCLVDALISDEWLLRRFRTIEAQLLARDMRRAYEPDKKSPLGQAYERGAATLERLQRRVNTTRRNYNRSLELLNKLRAETPAAPPKPLPAQTVGPRQQFVPSTPREAPIPDPAPQLPDLVSEPLATLPPG